MNEIKLALCWEDIPVGKENAVDYPNLCEMWKKRERNVRHTLHDLSCYDNGDNYVLIRSRKEKGFYRTDDKAEIEAYRKECMSRGRNIFALVKKCNRILKQETGQVEMFNNLRAVRVSRKITQKEVCNFMKKYDKAFDEPLLSKMESGVCLPTYFQLARMAEFYGVETSELVAVNLPDFTIYGAN